MRVRPYAGVTDDDNIATVRRAAAAVDGDLRLPGPGDPESCLIAESDGVVVGFSWLVRWTEDDGTEVFLLVGCVDPAHRGQGHGTDLLRHQEAYAVSLGAGAAHQVLAGNADDHHPGSRDLLLDNGFRLAFTVVDLACDPPGLTVRDVRPEHHPQLHAVIAECFAGTGNGFEHLDYDRYLADARDTDLWTVAWDGDQVAGLVTDERRPDGTVDSPWVAVPAAYRRRGVATALLRHNLATLRRAGVTEALLTTVAENENNTVGMYECAGYRVVQRHPRFRKPLGASGT
jgi:mycothiol synthase